jgi:hypothetical protein
MRRGSLLTVAALLAAPPAAWAQGNPLGPEFRVNTQTFNHQEHPKAAFDSAGNFVVVWASFDQDGSGNGVFGQRYAASGAPLGPEFVVNTYILGSQRFPKLASDAAGNFVVTWQSQGQDGSDYGIFAQRYASTGAPLGSEFRVNSTTLSYQSYPAVASDAAGNFVVVWFGRSTSDYDVFGQRFAASGSPLGGEFRVNSYTPGRQGSKSVAATPGGDFIVVWHSMNQDGSDRGVFGQRFASSGTPVGPEFRVNTYTVGSQLMGSVAVDAAGNFVVVWASVGQSDPQGDVFGQRFSASGSPAGGEFRVNSYTTNSQGNAWVAADAALNFVVVWESFPSAAGNDHFGQRYDSAGVPLGGEFLINTYTTGFQRFPFVAADPTGRFVAVWDSFLQDGSGFGVYGQRYAPILPVELVHFAVE